MSRWEPDARGRLGQAAMELYRERGFEQTTVAEIARRAGVTERTFFRHYADKREVLFAGSEALQERMVEALEAAPAIAPLDAVAAALAAAAGYFAELPASTPGSGRSCSPPTRTCRSASSASWPGCPRRSVLPCAAAASPSPPRA